MIAGGALVLSAISCNREVVLPPEINAVAPDAFTGEAQKGEILYEISGGSADVLTVDAATDSEWISGIDTDEPGVVSFEISENTASESREAVIVLSLPEAAPVDVKIVQYGADDVPDGPDTGEDEDDFTIKITDITAFSANVGVVPADKEMTYVVLTGTKEEVDGYSSDEELIEYNLSLFSSIAASQGVSLEYILDKMLLRSGNSSMVMNTFVPDTEYYVYVYGIDKFAEVSTPVYKKEMKTLPVTMREEKIDIAFSNVGTRSLTAEFTPESDEFRYACGWLTAAEYSIYAQDEDAFISTMITEIQYLINMYTSMGVDMTWSDFTVTGQQRITATSLNSDSGYDFYAFGLDSGYATTPLFHESVNTLAVEVTDPCTFELGTPSVETYEATVSVKPSSPSTKYFLTVLESSQVAGLSDAVIADACINAMSGTSWLGSLFSGDTETDFDGLVPNTSYTIVAFGVDGTGERSTAVATDVFRTQVVPASDMTFEVSVEDVGYSSVTVCVNPSSKEETYVMGILNAAQYAELGNDPEALGVKVCGDHANLAVSEYSGDIRQPIYMDYGYNFITPGTDYYVFVMGCSYWNRTTPVTVVPFSTPERTESDASVDIKVTVYDGNDLVAADPVKYPASGWADRAAVQVEFFPNGSAASWYGWIEERSAEYMSQLNRDVLLSAIKMNGTLFAGDKSGIAVVGVPWNYNNCSAIALGVDAEGTDGEPVIVSLNVDRSQIVEYDKSSLSSARTVYPGVSALGDAALRVRSAGLNNGAASWDGRTAAEGLRRYRLPESAIEKALAGATAGTAAADKTEPRTIREIARDNFRFMFPQ